MDGILEFLQTPLGQIIILVAVSIFFGKNPELINRILEILKIQKPAERNNIVSPESAVNLDDDELIISHEAAYDAAVILKMYFEDQGDKCIEGLEAAKKAGQCLFH